MTGAERLITAAKKELGYLEKKSNAQLDSKTANAGRKNFTKYARDLDALRFYNTRKQGFQWCCVFVSWCFCHVFGFNNALALTCQPKGGLGAGVKYAAQYYKKKDQFFSKPQLGDQIFFGSKKNGVVRWLHTGIVVEIKNGRVYTIEGNTSSGPDVIPNGGAVVRKSYSLTNSSIFGYGRPDWSLVKEETEDPEMAVYNTLKDVPIYYQPSIRKVMEKGALVGYEENSKSTIEDNVINVTEDFCRVMTTLDRLELLN